MRMFDFILLVIVIGLAIEVINLHRYLTILRDLMEMQDHYINTFSKAYIHHLKKHKEMEKNNEENSN